MTDEGSPPSAPRTNSAPLRSAQVASCSAAAARKVSPAAISTRRPACTCWSATLPMVVVLPTPLTPTNSHTLGDPASPGTNCRPRSAPSSRAVISARRASSKASGSVISFDATRARRPPSSSSVTRTPTSARSSASSSSSQVSAVIPERPRMPRNAPVSAERALPMRSRNDGRSAGTSTGTSTGGASTWAISSSDSSSLESSSAIGRGGRTISEVRSVSSTGGAPAARSPELLRRRFNATTPRPKTRTTTMRTR